MTKKNPIPGAFGETLGEATDILSELKKLIEKGQGAQAMLGLCAWLDNAKTLPATMVRSAVISQAPEPLALTLRGRWQKRGLAVVVVNGPPPSLKSKPIDPSGGQREKVRVPR